MNSNGRPPKARQTGNRPPIRLLGGAAVAAGFLLLSALPLAGLDGSIDGSYKSYSAWIYDPLWQGGSYGLSTGILRLNASIYPAKWASIELAYLLNPEIRAEDLSADPTQFGGGAEGYRVIDLRRRLLPWSSSKLNNIGLYNELDRAAVTFHMPFADVTAGRQAIAWGSARAVNPTDVLAPRRVSAVESEYRSGVDAVRMRIPFGAMHEADLGYVFGKDFRFEASAAFSRVKLHLLQTDITLLAMLFKENLMAGLDLARAIGEAGAWLEAAYVMPDIPAAWKAGNPWAEDYLQVSAGADYNFSAGLYGYLEYHFNSAGGAEASDYLALEDDPAYTEGASYLLGRHYLALGATYQLTPLLPASGLVLVNLNDPSLLLTLSLEYNIKENVYVEGGCTLGFGGDPLLSGGIPVEYRSEFGLYPNTVYAAVKLYF
jgi:hypothetical protein